MLKPPEISDREFHDLIEQSMIRQESMIFLTYRAGGARFSAPANIAKHGWSFGAFQIKTLADACLACKEGYGEHHIESTPRPNSATPRDAETEMIRKLSCPA